MKIKLHLTSFIIFLFACVLISTAQPGSLDLTFSEDGKQTTDMEGGNDECNSVAIQADGKIVIAGNNTNGMAIARYNANGSLDFTFSEDGRQTTAVSPDYNVGKSLAVQEDGKILLVGSSFSSLFYHITILRYNIDGSLDSNFDDDGIQINIIGVSSKGHSVVLQPDGKILLAGQISNENEDDFVLCRYNNDGSLDNTFSEDGIQTTDFGNFDRGYSVALQTDGKIVVAGTLGILEDHDMGIARYNSDGSLDITFGDFGRQIIDIALGDDYANSVAIQANGKIVVAGTNDSNFALVRLNSDGSFDNNFSLDGIQTTNLQVDYSDCKSVAIQTNGKIVVAGRIDADFAVLRYLSDGSLDDTFDGDGVQSINFGDYSFGNSVALQLDGKIVVAGKSATAQVFNFAIARLNGDFTSGIEENNEDDHLSISPNPSNGIFKITNLESEIINLEIFNVLGEKVYATQNFQSKSLQIDMSAQPDGIYFIRLISEKGIITKKIIKG